MNNVTNWKSTVCSHDWSANVYYIVYQDTRTNIHIHKNNYNISYNSILAESCTIIVVSYFLMNQPRFRQYQIDVCLITWLHKLILPMTIIYKYSILFLLTNQLSVPTVRITKTGTEHSRTRYSFASLIVDIVFFTFTIIITL